MEHAVIAYFCLADGPSELPSGRAAFEDLEDKLRDAIDRDGVGEFDGVESGQGQHVLYMYGPDADRLFACTEVLLRSTPLARRGYVEKRYGEAGLPGVKVTRIDLV